MSLRPMLAGGLLLLAAAPAAAEPVTLAGITFSDRLGGFVLEGGSGRGTLDDPFVLRERVTGNGPAILTVTGLSGAFGNRVGTLHTAGFAVTKIVVNGTDQIWQDYRVELQEQLGTDSTYVDGLSFGQAPGGNPRPFDADRFGAVRTVDEPLDGIAFTGGSVAPGEQAVIRFIVTDTSPSDPIFIVQRPEQPVALRQPAGGARLPG